MTPEQILTHPPSVLTEAQRQSYFRSGYLAAEGLIPDAWMHRLRELSAEFLEASKAVAASNEAFDLGPQHRPDQPHVRRLRALVDRHPDFWRFASESVLADIAADLVGPDVKFHSAKLNYKWPGFAETVDWHQDIPAWPHTNYSPVTLGVYLDDVPAEQGPLTCVQGSHQGTIFVHRNDSGNWTGSIQERDMLTVDRSRAEDLTGAAGTVIAINCRTVHASRANLTDRVRPVALFVYSSADAFPWTAAPTPTSHTGDIVRGRVAQMAQLDATPCPVPPDWSEIGYGSIFSVQRSGEAS
ncbi:MAG TPA: phytanoyl-CoA dioxygenase family protein [Acetobacteraceae bacterium]|nr:phytanoyl-CoA dioxygenase family protein [Acetobacteraceae bacterium]